VEFSVALDKGVLNKAADELESLYAAGDYLIAYQQLIQKHDKVDQCANFWLHTESALCIGFIVNWCKLFGVECCDRFWKQSTIEQKSYREHLYGATGFQYQEWSEYQSGMTAFYHIVLSHPGASFVDVERPDFEPALKVLQATHEWWRDLVNEFDLGLSGQVSDAAYFQRSAQNAASILNKIE